MLPVGVTQGLLLLGKGLLFQGLSLLGDILEVILEVGLQVTGDVWDYPLGPSGPG